MNAGNLVLRFVLELCDLGAAGAGLVSVGRARPGLLLVVLYAANRALMEAWDQ